MAEFIEIKIPQSIMRKYLEEREGKSIKITSYKRLGAGWHGTGYEIAYRAGKKEKVVILRTLRPGGFSHDYAADRGRVFILQHQHAPLIPWHIKSMDVGGYTHKRKLVSLGDITEFFQIVEKAEGQVYMDELNHIKDQGVITSAHRDKAKALSNYLVDLHRKKYKGEKELARSMYKRHLRDAVGHGEMLMGVLDTYPDKIDWISKDELTEIVCKAVRFRRRIKEDPKRLCRMHGDFHPGNIIGNKGFQVLDASREIWGEPADDLTALAINYIWFAVRHKGNFSGPFGELFRIFWDNYLEKTKDQDILKIVPLFFAFRGMVVTHPVFYPQQEIEVRRKMFNFVNNILEQKRFDSSQINAYLGV